MPIDQSAEWIPPRWKRAGWSELLTDWACLMDRYDEPGGADPARDVAYWYGERALSGLLAAAAWRRSDGWSLEEFTGRRASRRRRGAGRGDLWLGLGAAGYTIEAKVTWPPQLHDTARREADRALAAASSQLRSHASAFRWEETLLAVCFVVPELVPGKAGSAARDLRRLARSLRKSNTFVTVYRPNGSPPEDNRRVYPGVILVGRVAPS